MSIPASKVKELRDLTGAGLMDCKRALTETNGNVEKAIEFLRKKGIAKAEKRASKTTKEGVIEAYIHTGNRLGVLVEVNCETDFVARTDDFKKFAKEIAMQIAASNPLVITREQLSPEIIEKELDIYRTQAKNSGKPDKIIDRIAQGKLEKYFQEVCLLEQAYIRDPNKTVNDILMELAGKIGENISIKRFVRFRLGE
ncbi:translation elongation factor Ts [candidate division KSB1 bacterium]|nr:MAG: translation elongation factor Ts [candidate division KSB1 bacterium]